MLDYQSLLYGPIYSTFGQPAVLNANNGDAVSLMVENKTTAAPFMGVGATIEFQDFRPTARVRMAEILAAGLSVVDDVAGAELVMDGKSWTVKSYEYMASPVGNNDGELHLILSDDVDV